MVEEKGPERGIGGHTADLLGALQEKHTGEPHYTFDPEGYNPYANQTPAEMIDSYASQFSEPWQLEKLREGLDGIFEVTSDTPQEEWPELYTEARESLDLQIEKSKDNNNK